jgi:hypothetical protein
VKRRAELGDGDRPSFEVVERPQALLVGVVAGEVGDEIVAALFAAQPGDDLQPLAAGDLVEACRELARAEVHLARGERARDLVGRVEEAELHRCRAAEGASCIGDDQRRGHGALHGPDRQSLRQAQLT